MLMLFSGIKIGKTAVFVAPPTQDTWRSNDYVSAVRLVDAWLFYGVGR